jgi:nicotinate dehydrogenase subunit B
LPGTLAKFPDLDAWIRIGADGRVTVFTGKVELGTGVKTAMAQLAADELDVAIGRVDLITADTALTPNEGVTAGSQTLEQSGTAIANAAACVRLLLAETAAARWGVAATTLFTRDGVVLDGQGRRATYAELAASTSLAVRARADVPRKPVAARRLIGRPVPRVDLPAKLTGLPSYVQDMRLPDMVHARVLRGPSSGTRLTPDLAASRGSCRSGGSRRSSVRANGRSNRRCASPIRAHGRATRPCPRCRRCPPDCWRCGARAA